MTDSERWDHSIHYYPVLMKALPTHSAKALDIGCGNGILTRHLRTRVARVIGIDIDPPMIELAKKETCSSLDGIEFVFGDILTYPFELESFDVIASVATLHHIDTVAALQRIRSLLRPGGTLVIIGIARSRIPQDLFYNFGGIVASRLFKLKRTFWHHPAPMVWPPKDTFADVERIAKSVLGKDVVYRRHLLFRLQRRSLGQPLLCPLGRGTLGHRCN